MNYDELAEGWIDRNVMAFDEEVGYDKLSDLLRKVAKKERERCAEVARASVPTHYVAEAAANSIERLND